MTAGQAVRTLGCGLVAVMVAGLMPPALQAQVGITSGPAQVRLVARMAPRGAIEAVSPVLETSRQGAVQEAAVTVSLTANSGYRLVVLGTSQAVSAGAPRVWVRAADGEFRQVTPGASVTVARDVGSRGRVEREVGYRIEGVQQDRPVELPVRYEIVLTPTI